jgi:hypothetical protein
MKYAVEMVSDAMTYIPDFIKIVSGIHNFETHTQYGDFINLFLFFLQNKESRLIKKIDIHINQQFTR